MKNAESKVRPEFKPILSPSKWQHWTDYLSHMCQGLKTRHTGEEDVGWTSTFLTRAACPDACLWRKTMHLKSVILHQGYSTLDWQLLTAPLDNTSLESFMITYVCLSHNLAENHTQREWSVNRHYCSAELPWC